MPARHGPPAATLDKVLVRSPDVYARFVDQLEYLLRDGLSASFVADTAQRQLANIFGLVSDNETAAGLRELVAESPATADAATSRFDIADTLLYYTGWLEERVRCARLTCVLPVHPR